MAWTTTPKTWTANELVTATMLNAELRDRLLHYYNNLPYQATLWHQDSIVDSGNAITGTVQTSHAYNMLFYQNTAANGDQWHQDVLLAAGTYTLKLFGATNNNAGKLDLSLGGVAIATGQDWYSASLTLNTTKTVTGITVSEGGRLTLQGTVNGKHASSSSYSIYLTKLFLYRTGA